MPRYPCESIQRPSGNLSRSRSEHVWPEHERMMRDEIKAYQKYRKLHGELIELCIELSKAKIALLRENSSH
jgi:hypothetical protein